MQSDWPEVSVLDVCSEIVDCINKTAPKVDGPTPYRMVRTTNIRNGRLDLSNVKYVTKDVYERWTRRVIPRRGDVLFTREAPLGEAAMVTDQRDTFLGQRTVLYRANSRVMDPRFLLYSFLGPALKHQFYSFEGSGSTVSHIRVPDCKKFILTLPPLPEQRRIAAVLGALDDKIELNRKMNQTLEEMAQVLFKAWFIDFDSHDPADLEDSELGPIPRGWSLRQVRDLEAEGSLLVQDGNHGEYRPRRAEYDTVGTAFIRAGDMRDGEVLFGAAPRINEIALARIRKGIGAPGDVLLSHKGTVGRVAVAPLDCEPFVCSPQTTFWRPSPNSGIGRSFLYFFLRSPLFQRQLNARKGETSMADYVSLTAQRRLWLLAPGRRSSEFQATTEPLFLRYEQNQGQSRTLAELRDALLPKLISGEIRVPEAEAAAEAVL